MSIDIIRKSHASAKPTAANPAWVNTHRDLTVVLRHVDVLELRLSEILEIVDGMEDIDANGGPNLAMRIAQVARGEDRP